MKQELKKELLNVELIRPAYDSIASANYRIIISKSGTALKKKLRNIKNPEAYHKYVIKIKVRHTIKSSFSADPK